MELSGQRKWLQYHNNTEVGHDTAGEGLGTAFLPFHPAVVIILAFLSFSLLLNASPILGIPHHRSCTWTPGGHLLRLGIHNWRTGGGVFDWFSHQCLALNSPIIQLFLPVYSISRPVVLIADIREIEDISLRRNSTIDRASLLQDFFGLLFPKATIGMPTHGLFKRQRRLWNCVLAPNFMGMVVEPHLYSSILELIHLWREKTELARGLPFVAAEDVRQTALDAMWTILAGTELGLLRSQTAQLQDLGEDAVVRKDSKAQFANCKYPLVYRALSVLLIYWVWLVQGPYPRFCGWLFPRIPHFKSTHKAAKDAVSDALMRARERAAAQQHGALYTQTCGLEEVLKRAAAEKGFQDHASDAALEDELLELLVSGHETTAVAISWGLKYLADNQPVQAHLLNSLRCTFPDCSDNFLPRASEIMSADIPYLDAFLAELLRLCCTIPVSFRETIVDCNILGYEIPAKTTLILLTGGPSHLSNKPFLVQETCRSPSSRAAALRMKPRDWDPAYDLSSFLPERWLAEDGTFDPKSGPTLPFSAGIRGCYGKSIAMMELRLFFVMVMLSFRLEEVENRWSGYGSFDGLTRRPTFCYVRPERRN